ncbi:amidase signature enzyme [Panus rudis PR-1116 ss-1]|nr:amidase signature enzyme [Panus rudis PR-1116 ss-1]
MRSLRYYCVLFATTYPFAQGVQVPIQTSGLTLTLGGIPYFVPPTPVSNLLASIAKTIADPLMPFSVIPTTRTRFDEFELTKTVTAWKSTDDVWSESFLTGIYVSFNGTGRNPSVSLSRDVVKGLQVTLQSKQYPSGVSTSLPIPAGPYFLNPDNGDIFEAWRLFSDENQAFLYGTIPDGHGGFQQLSAHIDGAATETIAVPSRLYFTPTAERPLAGKRLGVKDIYDVKGLRTGCGNRAFYSLYPPKNTTSPAVQRLLDGGMILVGKTKTSQFANGEHATEDWVDLHAPYNPRGDGYQDGSSSSTGSGTSIAAYGWLDHTIGSDTGGSMRGPSGANGVFGNRPSHGAVPLDNVMPLSPELDTGGIFARDAKSWAAAGHWWYQGLSPASRFPKKILFPLDTWGSSFLNDPPRAGTASALFNDFIKKLEDFLGTTRIEFNLIQSWTETKPPNTTEPTLSELLNTTYADLITLDQLALVADPFIADHKAAHSGRSPFIDPAPLARWSYGRTLPPSQKGKALQDKTVFMEWFADQIVRADSESCSESIFLYPQSSGRANYRNQYGGPPGTPFGFSTGRIAVFAEVPDMVVPIGELPFNSTISGVQEFLPVTLSFIAAKGCDLMLFDLFAALQDAGFIRPVKTGARAFG